MSIATTAPVTLEEFLRLEAEAPEGVTLELIDGEIVERPMTVRRPSHTRTSARIVQALLNWLDSQSEIAGTVDVGEVRCRLSSDPETIVGIDVGFWEGPEFANLPASVALYDGPPTVAVEVLSPSDTHEGVTDKLLLYLSRSVPQVWIVDPDLETVTIHRPDAEPQLFSSRQTLTAEPELPGFRVPVSQLFHPRSTSVASH